MDSASIAEQPSTNGINHPQPRRDSTSDQWTGALLPSTLRRLKGLELVGGFDLPKLMDDALTAELASRVQFHGDAPKAGNGRGRNKTNG